MARHFERDTFGLPVVALPKPYEGRHRAEERPAGRHRAADGDEHAEYHEGLRGIGAPVCDMPAPADLDDDGLRDAHVDLASLPLTHGQMSEGWAISSRHRASVGSTS